MNIRQILTLLIPALMWVVTISDAAAEGTRKKNPHSRWEPAIRRFEEADRKNPKPRDGVLFVGSSSIRFWDLKKSFPKLEAINHGFGGSEIADTVHFVDRIVWPFTPRVIVFYAGDNDIAGGNSAEETAKDFKTFSKQLHEQLPDTQLIYVAIKPSIARWSLSKEMSKANAAIAEQCRLDDKRIFLNIWTPMLGDNGQPKPDLFLKDGLHLNAAGYELWTKLTFAELQKLSFD
jgi:lysophospholipase L1-like esterase